MNFELRVELQNNKEIMELLVRNSVNGMTVIERFHQCVTSSPKLILVKTTREIQAKYYNHGSRRSLAVFRPLPVGPLVHKPQDDNDGDVGDDEKIMDWLSKKEPSSVVFVAFGTESYLSEEDMKEMADGLELSNVDFIWVVRFHGGSKITSIHEALPQGFLERTNGRGLIVEGWAPQAKILQHSSTGGFVSHCGWNSTLEAMAYGIPIIAIPMQLDQPTNAKYAVDMGVGIEMPRKNKQLAREEVASVIRRVVTEEEGTELRKKAKELSERLKKEEDDEFDEAMEKLVQLVHESRI
ncbi:hypothetical protein JRO89_XS04G0007600 [Xanthoceras sorbifolium]|uniref:UDP-glycosyltransferases domain-containing protein n=1 Tax=Xanthoceras sorbifolium TaxID=99658 RepID=A0ABQ8I3M6_9ROSI|nr:hypothetical protein JRO89_XS04G0007600 [Xanthoceras sorbifolium]